MKEQYKKDWDQMRDPMPAPFSMSETYQIWGNYLRTPARNWDLCVAELQTYFVIPPQDEYVHFRFYTTPQPGTVRLGRSTYALMVLVGERMDSVILTFRIYYTLQTHFALAKTQVLYVALCEGPFDRDCNTLPDTVQYPHITDPIRG